MPALAHLAQAALLSSHRPALVWQDANVKLLRGRAEESFLRQGAADQRKGGA